METALHADASSVGGAGAGDAPRAPAAGLCGLTAAVRQLAVASLLSTGPAVRAPAAADARRDVLNHPIAPEGCALPLGWWNEDLYVLPALQRYVAELRDAVAQLAARRRRRRGGGGALDPLTIPNSLVPIALAPQADTED